MDGSGAHPNAPGPLGSVEAESLSTFFGLNTDSTVLGGRSLAVELATPGSRTAPFNHPKNPASALFPIRVVWLTGGEITAPSNRWGVAR